MTELCALLQVKPRVQSRSVTGSRISLLDKAEIDENLTIIKLDHHCLVTTQHFPPFEQVQGE